MIRRADPGDAEAIVAVARATWKVAYAGIIPEDVQELAMASWYALDRIAQQAADPAHAFFVATDDVGGIIGFTFVSRRREPGYGDLKRFYVLPGHQGKGLGRQMLTAALEALRANGPVVRLFVEVEKGNVAGVRTYEALGFQFLREYDDDICGFITQALELYLDL